MQNPEKRGVGRPRSTPESPYASVRRTLAMATYYTDPITAWISAALSNRRKHCKQTGKPCHLTFGEVSALLEQTNGVCPLTGIRFNLSRGRKKREYDSACLDLIDPKGEVTKDNCRVVSWRGKVEADRSRRAPPKEPIPRSTLDVLRQMRAKAVEITQLRAQLAHHQAACDTLGDTLNIATAGYITLQDQLADELHASPQWHDSGGHAAKPDTLADT